MITFLTAMESTLACSICWGGDGNALSAANAGIGLMLVFVVGVLGSILSFIFYLARKGRQAEASNLDTPPTPSKH